MNKDLIMCTTKPLEICAQSSLDSPAFSFSYQAEVAACSAEWLEQVR